MFRNETISTPSAVLVARLTWLRLQQGPDGSKLEPVTRSSMYSHSNNDNSLRTVY